MQSKNRREWVVMKFGGTSVSSAQRWSTIATQVRARMQEGKHVLVVVSALSGVTDMLNRLADEGSEAAREGILQEILQRHRLLMADLGIGKSESFELHWGALTQLVKNIGNAMPPTDRALLLAHGELMSSAVGAEVLRGQRLPIVLQDARQLLHATISPALNPVSVRCEDHADPALEERLGDESQLHITQGFIVSGPDGATCLLGRGGSDTSAALLAARLKAAALEIWTDVPGMFSADPKVVPDARLLVNLGYREAQELASMGAKVLHPPSIQPARRHGIPVFIRDTSRPGSLGTCITAGDREAAAQVKGVVSRRGITLINMESAAMWHQAGFLADAFSVFKKHGYSVDLIATSESSVTVSLDPEMASDPDGSRLDPFLEELAGLCKLEMHTQCVSISLVGNAIRTILGRLSAALDVFQDRHVHMVTQSANDLNLTLVVDAEHAESLVRKLHQLLISSQADNRIEFGPSWADLNSTEAVAPTRDSWWRAQAANLVKLLGSRDCAYVYHLPTAERAAQRLVSLQSIDRVLYSAKANDHPQFLTLLAAQGLGFECVSLNEVDHVLQSVSGLRASDVLFTPNFAPRAEYEGAYARGVRITVDNAWALYQWPETFAGKEVFLRLDLERGHGHHRKVVTSGKDSKFGIALEDLDALLEHLDKHEVRVTGLHAHTGSGVNDATVWGEQLERIMTVLPRCPDVKVVDLGGGLGIPDRPGQPVFDLQQLDQVLMNTLGETPVQLWLEPGRYLVAECGVLLARVTQLKNKGHYHYVGVATGMNSLIRPALYGAYHEIVNLDQLAAPAEVHCRVVGPICESGDVLGESRLLPNCQEGDVLLIANTGAYGRVMASQYNRRLPAEELFIAE